MAPIPPKTKILNVDDNEASLYAKSHILRRAGFEIKEASTGGEALRLVTTERFPLVLLDVHLPDMSGFEVCRRIKANPATASTIVLQISASFVDGRDKVRGLEGGADTYLTEPIEPEVLVANVKALLRLWQAEETLRQKEAELVDFLENATVGLHWVDGNGIVVWANRAEMELLGYTREEYIGHHIAEFHADQEVIDDILQRLTGGEILHEYEARLRCKDGSIRHVLINSSVLWDEISGEFVHTRCFTRDITERKRAEEKLKAVNATLEQRVLERTAFVQLLQDIAIAANEATTVEPVMQFALNQICAHIGWPVGHVYLFTEDNLKELAPTTIWCLEPSGHFAAFREITEATNFAPGVGLPGRVLAKGEPILITDVTQDSNFPRAKVAEEVGLKAGFGIPVWVGQEVVAVLEFFSPESIQPEGALVEVLTHIGTQLGRVVERKRAEKKTKESERQLAEAQQIAHIGSWRWDIPTNTLAWSDELYRIYGLKPQEFRMTYEEFLVRVHPDDRELVSSTVSRAYQDHRPFSFEHRIIHPDGTVRILFAQGNVVVDEMAQPVKMIGTGQDITERKQTEAELVEVRHRLTESREAERLYLAQELHDGPVQELYGVSYRLSDLAKAPMEEESLAQLAATQAALQRVIQMLRATASDLRPPALAPFGLEKAIRSHAEQFQAAYPALSVRLELMPDGQALPERIRLALFRIYQEALNNVMRHAEAQQVLIQFTLNGEQAVLKVQDDGRGFEVPGRWIHLARQGHLGLVGISERAEAIGGQLQVVSTPGAGAKIQVAVPRLD